VTTAATSRDKPEKGDKPEEKAVKRFLRTVDRAQQSRRGFAFVYGVVKKYGDDSGGALAALLTYYGFLSVFPLLLVLVTVLGIVAGSNHHFEQRVLDSALGQFPVIGDKLGDNIKALHRDSPLSLTVGILGLLWGATGISQSAQFAMAQIWNIPKMARPGFLPRLARSGWLLLVTGVFLIVSSGLAGVATVSGAQGPILRLGTGLLSAIADVVLFVIVYRILTPASIHWHNLIPGSVLAGVLWAGLQTGGVFLMDHELRNISQVYGFFAIVLGTLWWIYLAAQIVVYAAETNVVFARRLWPRGLVQPPLTAADITALGSYALAEQRRPEVRVTTSTEAGVEEITPRPSSRDRSGGDRSGRQLPARQLPTPDQGPDADPAIPDAVDDDQSSTLRSGPRPPGRAGTR
jgi:YihY family inner membrane protein